MRTSVTTDTGSALSAKNGHSHCLLCGDSNPWSFQLCFEFGEDDIASARFRTDSRFQGYAGILHGGIVATLLDSAMTHCLFHHNVRAVTGDLQIRFVEPVSCDAILDIRAWIVSQKPPLYRLRAELVHEGRVKAWGEAKFMKCRGLEED